MKNSFKKSEIANLEKSLVEDIPVLLPVLPQDNLAEVRVVDQSVNIHLVGHVDHLLLTRIEAQSFHGIKSILGGIIFCNYFSSKGVFHDNAGAVKI